MVSYGSMYEFKIYTFEFIYVISYTHALRVGCGPSGPMVTGTAVADPSRVRPGDAPNLARRPAGGPVGAGAARRGTAQTMDRGAGYVTRVCVGSIRD